MTQQLNISRQAYYKAVNKVNIDSDHDRNVINKVFAIRSQMPRLGTRKLHFLLKPQLKKEGLKYGRDKLNNLLKSNYLLVPKKKNYTITTRSYKRFNQHPNRIKDLKLIRPEQVWVADITYIKTKNHNLYLSLITDAYSKKIMGYKISDDMKTQNNIDALNMAINNRKFPDKSLIHHSDRGFQYCAQDYTDQLQNHNIQISMTTKYDPYENAIAERINGILKDEFDISNSKVDPYEATKIIHHAIKTYNNLRPHLSCQYLTPNQAHNGLKFKLKTYKKAI